MTTEADILPGHAGSCKRVDVFPDGVYERVAGRVTRDYERRFAEHGAVIRVLPIETTFTAKRPASGKKRFGFLGQRYVRARLYGEGLQLFLEPLAGGEPPKWMWWVEGEAAILLRQRQQGVTEWTVVHTPEQVETLLRKQADVYHRQLLWSVQHSDAPYHEHDGSA